MISEGYGCLLQHGSCCEGDAGGAGVVGCVSARECVCVPVPTGHRHISQTCQDPSAGQCSVLRREFISSTMQFNSLNSQMKLSLLVGNLNCFTVFSSFVYVHLASRHQQRKHNINQDAFNLRAVHFQTGLNSMWISV